MKNINYQYFKSSFGELILGSYDGKLSICDWRYRKKRSQIDSRIEKGLSAKLYEKNDPLIENAINQLEEYFNHKRKVFSMSLLMVGTEFQKNVWNGLNGIAFGETLSYLQLAEKVASKNAIRAVANANGANAISIFIPCHRIIGSNGQLVGYAGGLDTKKKLLGIENYSFNL